MPQQLSPAAQAVLDAYRDADIDDAVTAAAVLRAVADQLFSDWDGMCCEEHLNSIAAELEAQ